MRVNTLCAQVALSLTLQKTFRDDHAPCIGKHRPLMPPTHARLWQESRLSPTPNVSPSGQVQDPPQTPTLGASSMSFPYKSGGGGGKKGRVQVVVVEDGSVCRGNGGGGGGRGEGGGIGGNNKRIVCPHVTLRPDQKPSLCLQALPLPPMHERLAQKSSARTARTRNYSNGRAGGGARAHRTHLGHKSIH